MENKLCFLGSFVGTPQRVQYQPKNHSYVKHRFSHSHARERKQGVRCCLQGNDRTEGQNPNLEEEFQNVVRMSAQNPGDENQQSNRRIMDGITETGVKEIEGLANEMKDELEDLQRLVEENADRFIEEETQQVLQSYDQKQRELLGRVEKDQQVISAEIEHITELAKNVENGSSVNRSKTLREKAYFIMCLIFASSALYYAWTGFVDSDATALTNASINATVAAACTYFYSKERVTK